MNVAEQIRRIFGAEGEKTPTEKFELKLRNLLSETGFEMITQQMRTMATGRGSFDTQDSREINRLIEAALASPLVKRLTGEERAVFENELNTYIRTGEVQVPVEERDTNQENTHIATLDDLRELLETHEVVSDLFKKLEMGEISDGEFAEKVGGGSYTVGENFLALVKVLLEERHAEEKQVA